MSIQTQTTLSPILESLARSLDIPPSKYEEAVNRYQAVGEWLDAVGSALKPFNPRVYPQGSFRLGTVIRPVSGGKVGDYDIDLVCLLHLTKGLMTPERLKQMVGDRLKEHKTYERMLDEEGRRCWTLEYAESDGVGFHLDVLPACPEDDAGRMRLVIAGVPDQYATNAIAITELGENSGYTWVPGGSNPMGFAEWFDSVNLASRVRVADVQKRMLAESHRNIYASVDAVPDALIRTPLQRAIQILKRHRDTRFSGHEWEKEKPISMVITTLAALAYDGQTDVATTLEAILGKIDDFSTSGIISKQSGKWVIPNPVNPGENFANRWNDPGSNRADAFFEWVGWVQQDLFEAAEKAFESDTRQILTEALGVSDAPRATGTQLLLKTGESVPGLAAMRHKQLPPWLTRLQHNVEVTGHVRRSMNSERNMYRLTSKPVRKGQALKFHAKTDVPPPYTVMWQVVNTRPEAARGGAVQLRGGFDEGDGRYGNTRMEQTAYRGTHTIEAFVVKDGVCVAKSEPQPVRIA